MGRHESAPGTFDAVVSDYVTQRARELVRQADTPGELLEPLAAHAWIGHAAEVLRELTREA